MKSKIYILSLAILTCLFGISTIIVFSYNQKETKEYIYKEHPRVLEEAAIANAQRKASDLYMSGTFNKKSDSIGSYEIRTFRDADTTFEYRSKIVNIETQINRSRQSYLLSTRDLHSSEIQILFDSLLQQKGIYVPSVIGITDTFYIKLNDWSRDTTQFKANIKSSFAKQGIFEDINYHAYSDISFLAVWKLMPKMLIYILLSMTLLVGGLLVYTLKRKPQKEEVIIEPSSEIEIPVTETATNFSDTETLKIEDKKIIGGRVEVKLSAQPLHIINMFLENDNRVSKDAIKKRFWEHNIDSTNNMTTTINRLKLSLDKAECGWTIITDPADDEYYLLKRNQK